MSNGIGFWKQENGNLLMQKRGLTKEEIEAFQQLKEGDRLILFENREKRKENSPDFTLKKCITKVL